MKKSFQIAPFFFISVFSLFSQDFTEISPQEFQKIQKEFEIFFPNQEGSSLEMKLLLAIRRYLNALSISFKQYSFTKAENYHSFSAILEADIPGKHKDQLIIAVPLNSRKISAGLVIALQTAAYFKKNQPSVSIKFLFLGADLGAEALGSTYYLSQFHPNNNIAMIYLYLNTIVSTVRVHTGSSQGISPEWLVQASADLLKQNKIPFQVLGEYNKIFRLGFADSSNLLKPYLKYDYPVVLLENNTTVLNSEKPTLENWQSSIASMLVQFTQCYSEGFSKEWDKHYLFFNLTRKNFLIVSEKNYLLFVITVVFSLIAIGIFFSVKLKKQFFSFKKDFWSIPILYSITVVFLFISTIIIQSILFFRNFPSLWEYAPQFFLFLKILFILFFYSMFFLWIRNIEISKQSDFYASAAFYLNIINFVLISFINISFSYFILWALLFNILFIILSSVTARILCLAASVFWFVKAAWDIFTLPILSVAQLLLFSKLLGNAILALILLPFFCMLFCIKTMKPVQRSIYLPLYPMFAAGLSVLFYLLLLFFHPFNKTRAQPIFYNETADLDSTQRKISLTSPASYQNIFIDSNGSSFYVSKPVRSSEFVVQDIPDVLSIQIQTRQFLNRNQINLTVLPIGNPESIALTLSSDKSILLYDCNFPNTQASSAHQVIIHIGKNPPKPLLIELTLEQELRASFHFSVIYKNFPYPVIIDAPEKQIEKTLTVTKTLSLQSEGL